MAWPRPALWFDVLGGQNSHHMSRLRQDQELVEMSQALNVLPDPAGKLVTREGFSHVRATGITGTTTVTGLWHMGDLSDKLVLGSNGKLWLDDANPPSEITGGTAFTAGSLMRAEIFNGFLIVTSQARDLPQTVNSSATRADLGGTPARGLDVKAFGRRVFMFSPSYGGTTYRHRAMFNSSDDNQAAWTTPDTLYYLNFGREGAKVNVLGGEVYADHLVSFTEDSVFPVYTTPNATLPFAFQKDILAEDGGGPPIIHSVVKANDRLYWLSKNYDMKEMLGFQIKSKGFPIQPFLRGLSDSRRVFTVGFWEPKYRLVCWAVSDGADSTNQDIVAYHPDSGQFYFFTLSVASACLRTVSGELRCMIGHYNGKFSNLFDGSTTGDLQDATSVIDADVMTPRHHLGMPNVVKKVPYVCVEFDPIGSESVTVQYQLDDSNSWSSFTESAFSPSGNDGDRGFFTIPAPFENIRLRFRDANSGERYRVVRYGFPSPKALTMKRN